MGGGSQRMTGSYQQIGSDPLFEAADPQADRGLAHSEVCRCSRHAALVEHRQVRPEGLHVKSHANNITKPAETSQDVSLPYSRGERHNVTAFTPADERRADEDTGNLSPCA